MPNVHQESEIYVACRLLELYKVADSVSHSEIRNFKTCKSQLYGMTNIHSFDYKHKHYYVSDDYSLMDDPKYLKNVLRELHPNLKGSPMKNPVPQSDGAKYASGFGGREYYLWEVTSK